MSPKSRFLAGTIVLLASTALALQSLHAQGASLLFLKICSSPRAAALGGCSANLVDEEAALYDPAAMGLFHLQKVLAISLPSTTGWLPNLASSQNLNSYSLSAGISLSRVKPKKAHRLNVAVAIGLSKLRLDFELQKGIGVAKGLGAAAFGKPYDDSRNFGFAVALEYYARIGVGVTRKRIESQLATYGVIEEVAKPVAYDYGIIADLPIMRLLNPRGQGEAIRESEFRFEITPSVAYIRGNVGDPIDYAASSFDDPLPKMSKLGFGLGGTMHRYGSPIASFLVVRETEKDLVDRRFTTDRLGVEVGLFGILYVREGRIDDDEGGIALKTSGYGISVAGVIDWIYALSRSDRMEGLAGDLIDHFNFTVDHASFSGRSSQPLDKTTFLNAHFSF